MASAIEDYALIGDCETAALVSQDGSIDWLCWPRFDSAACFAALLGGPENGRWRLAPSEVKQVRRRYRTGTLILETEFETATGAVTLTDFMPLRDAGSNLLRVVRGTRGEVEMNMELVMRFDYGYTVPWVTRRDDSTLAAVAGPHKLLLRTPVPVRGEDLKTTAAFRVHEGQQLVFELTYGISNLPDAPPVNAQQVLEETEKWWTDWSSRCTYSGPWEGAVRRSLITLKALTYQPTGGIIAAPSCSLPERIGGTRNWDYRFCWLRDATFTLFALMEAGYYDEAREWRDWLVRTVAGSPNQTQILYGVGGERQFFEWEVPWLKGFRDSSPVRVGNAAAGQLQLDVFGEVADVLHQARSGKVPEYEPAIELQRALTGHLEEIWQEADKGLWEFRGRERHFTHSKVMAWVAFDRMVKDSESMGLDGEIQRWRSLRQQIHEEVCWQGFNPDLNSFVQSYGSCEADASLLLLPVVGFLPASDPRVAGTVRFVEERLLWDGFVRRYDTRSTEDGLPAGEGAFLACTCWLADCYILQGRKEEAEALLQRVAGVCNDVGLLAEQYHPERRCLLGNFPQAFSHVALVNTILNLSREQTPVEKRAQAHERTSSH
ncbi:MAG TPA: glycoside hydrolase family 15 protein [Terriglobales bacterium]